MNLPAMPLAPSPDVSHTDLANAIRALSMDAVERAQSGHPGMPMGMADVATVLFTRFLKFDPRHPEWPDRDRFVLSAGHGSMLLYSLLYLTGYERPTLEDIQNFRQWGSPCAGHPEYGHLPGVETTTGPLGQGLANAVGMALGEAMTAARFPGLFNHHTYVIAGDGCLMEGIAQEAIELAGHLRLSKLIVLWDDNRITIDGPTSLSVSTDQCARFEASGWQVQAVDGHDPEAIARAIEAAQASPLPSLIACRTTIGYGAPKKGGTADCHGSPLGAEEIKAARERLGWSHPPFEIPSPVLAEWHLAGQRNAEAYTTWVTRFDAAPAHETYERQLAGELPDGWAEALNAFKRRMAETAPKEATRKSSQNVLEVLNPLIPELIGGSADLTGSNNTKTKGLAPVTRDDYAGRYLYYGIREHAMGAVMNGLALHGGVIPYGGTFLVFSDYCRPAIRLAALMGLRVVYVMTHDSIGLGEDGPTHQPVEHLASLRAIPGLAVFRPADAVETAEAWALAISGDGPGLLALSRQNLPTLRTAHTDENRVALGGYVLIEAENAKATLIATGSELSLVVEAHAQLKAKGIATRVVSLPCWELFDAQPQAYRTQVLGTARRIAVEAASGFGWEKYLGENGAFIGMTGFGASAPAPELYAHFGITVEAVVKAVKG